MMALDRYEQHVTEGADPWSRHGMRVDQRHLLNADCYLHFRPLFATERQAIYRSVGIL
jgi:hypothetical protein